MPVIDGPVNRGGRNRGPRSTATTAAPCWVDYGLCDGAVCVRQLLLRQPAGLLHMVHINSCLMACVAPVGAGNRGWRRRDAGPCCRTGTISHVMLNIVKSEPGGPHINRTLKAGAGIRRAGYVQGLYTLRRIQWHQERRSILRRHVSDESSPKSPLVGGGNVPFHPCYAGQGLLLA